MNDIKVGDLFVDFEGYKYILMKINAQGEPEKHANYPYRLESIQGIGFWDAYQTLEDAVEEIEYLIDDKTLEHYSCDQYELSITVK